MQQPSDVHFATVSLSTDVTLHTPRGVYRDARRLRELLAREAALLAHRLYLLAVHYRVHFSPWSCGQVTRW